MKTLGPRRRSVIVRAASTLVAVLALASCSQDEDAQDPEADAPSSASPSESPSGSPSASPPDAAPRGPESTTLPAGELSVVGAWETRELLGEALDVGRAYGRPQVLYAVADHLDRQRRPLVSMGLREGRRIFRTLPALTPASEEAPDGVDLYGGMNDDGAYELLGSAPGDVTVSVAGPDGRSRPVTAQSTRVLPGFTVFYDAAPWQPGWEPLELAPLVVTTDSGVSVRVRERSWEG